MGKRDWVWQAAIDAVIVVALWGLSIITIAQSTEYETTARFVLGYVSAGVMTLPLFIRRTHPMVAMWIAFVGGLFNAACVYFPTPAIVAVPLIAYAVARHVDGKKSRTVIVLGVVGSLIAGYVWLGPRWREFWTPRDAVTTLLLVAITCSMIVLTSYGLGRRAHMEDIAHQREEAERLEHVRLDMARRHEAARAAEMRARTDIAREMHDIVAHSLAIMIVQADGGRAIAEKQPERAAEVLETIADTGREALTEMRRLVSILRADPVAASDDYAPAAGLADITDMIQRAGDRVELRQTGDLPTVPATLGLAVYRVTQEAVTNFLKHAGPDARATVALAYSADRIDLEVSDNGVGSLAPNDGNGHGIQGMRERVASMGGTLDAGPLLAGGYRIRASFPLNPLPPAKPSDQLGLSDGDARSEGSPTGGADTVGSPGASASVSGMGSTSVSSGA